MNREILIHPAFCAVTEDGRLAEYIPRCAADQSGDILLAKIDRMMPGMNCAFADVGRKRSGFLPLQEDSASFRGSALRSGSMAVVQIRKEEKGEKGVFLTRDIALPGRLVLVMPMNRHIGVSGRVAGEETREQMKKTGRSIAGNRFGLVMRNAAEKAPEEEIREEAETLFREWQAIEQSAMKASKPGTILRAVSLPEMLKADYSALGFSRVLEVDRLEPALERQLKRAAQRTVPLPGGGNIVIDRCEAMTVIDVNTASFTGGADKARTVLEVNLEACETAAAQVRLRNLSGIILVDFIDMDSDEDRVRVADRLAACFREDRVKTVFHGWTSLGLAEITRKRTRPSLYEERFIPCEVCGGNGYILKEQA